MTASDCTRFSSSSVAVTPSKLQVYVLSKLLTEEKAFQFAKEKGIDLVSIIPTTVAGPFLTPSVPASVQVLLSPITGNFQPNLLIKIAKLFSLEKT